MTQIPSGLIYHVYLLFLGLDAQVPYAASILPPVSRIDLVSLTFATHLSHLTSWITYFVYSLTVCDPVLTVLPSNSNQPGH